MLLTAAEQTLASMSHLFAILGASAILKTLPGPVLELRSASCRKAAAAAAIARATQPNFGGQRRGPASEQTVGHDADDADRALVFEPFRGFVEFLERDFHVLDQRIVVDELANRAVAPVDLFGWSCGL